MHYSLDYFFTYGARGKIYVRCNRESQSPNPYEPHQHSPYQPYPHDRCEPYPRDRCEPHPHDRCEPHPHDHHEPHPHDRCEPHPRDRCELHPHDHHEPHPHDRCEPHPHDHKGSPHHDHGDCCHNDDRPHHYKVRYTLFREGEKVESKTADDDELVCFQYSCSANYAVRARITNPRGKDHVLYTPVITPVEDKHLSQQQPPPPTLKGYLALPECGPAYLKVQFCKGGLKKLKNEDDDRVPVYCKLRENVEFVPCFSKDTLERITKYTPEYSTLHNFYRVKITIPAHELLELGNELEGLEYVEYCIIQGDVAGIIPERYPITPPPCWPAQQPPYAYGYRPQPPASWESNAYDAQSYDAPRGEPSSPFNFTPDFTPRQTFLNAGTGMNVRAAWSRGITGGTNINTFIMDSGVFRHHEDLANVTIVTNDEIFMGPNTPGHDHGTASAGVLVASSNGFGVAGIAFNGRCLSYGRHPSDLDAIIARALPGDVFSISLGAPHPTLSLPTVHDQGWFTGIRQLVQAGVVVVTSAANGGINLINDQRFINRGDSGVIMAAAINPITRRREFWSNFNWNRMLHAWGSYVPTTGYTTIFNPGPLTRRYGYYGGTSAAAPQIAGVAALVQSYARTKYRTIFNTEQMYDILSRTGYAEAQQDLIGRRPNALAAIEHVDRLLGSVYPTWNRSTIYMGGNRVSWAGSNWEARWWTQLTEPGTRDRYNEYPWRRL